MTQSILQDFLRSAFFVIDMAVYYLIEGAYNVLNEIAGVALLDNATLESFASRIYLLLGIFALFKITFSLITMFMNPDSFTDPKTGGGKLVKQVLTVLVLIIFVPYIFRLAFRLQAIVINNNVLPTIILGNTTPETEGDMKSIYDNAGRSIATTVFKGFFTPNFADAAGNADLANCDGCDYYNQSDAAMYKFGGFLNEHRGKTYFFDYNVLISTIAGGLAAFMMVMFSFDVAIRAVKLSFLQLIAPLPIIMSIDPKKGEGILKKWISTVTTTYLDLFMRLIVIYFVIYILAVLTQGNGLLNIYKYNSEGIATSGSVSVFASVFIILGLLLFAKEAPNLIYDMLGVKPPTGGFGLNPMKRLSSVPLLGGVLGSGASRLKNLATSSAKLAGSKLKSKALSATGDKAGAAAVNDAAMKRFKTRQLVAKQEARERLAANKFGGNDKYTGTTVSGIEQKEKTDAFNKEIEAGKDIEEKKYLHAIGTEKRDASYTYKTRDGSMSEPVKFDKIKEIPNSADRTAAYAEVFGDKDYASSFVNVEYQKEKLNNEKVKLQTSISKLQSATPSYLSAKAAHEADPNNEDLNKAYLAEEANYVSVQTEYKESEKNVATNTGILKGYEDNHEKVQASHKDAAKIEKAIKVSKGPVPGSTATFDTVAEAAEEAKKRAEKEAKAKAAASSADDYVI